MTGRRHVLILGAGFGGLELATLLSSDLSDQVHVTLIDQNDSFIFGFQKFDVVFGRKTTEQVRSYYRDIAKDGVEFRQERVTSIDPASRGVVTDGNTYEPDVLVVALGADYEPEATPGFVEGGYEFFSVEGAERVRDVLPSFRSGRLVLSVLSVPYKCPPAPYEAMFYLHDYFTEAGVREAIDMHLITPLESAIPVSRETSEAIAAGLDERGIRATFGHRVHGLDPSSKTARMKEGDIPYDLLLGVPKHKAPDVVQASGLTEGGIDGWIHVDARNLRTPYPEIYALGDVADAPVPRAGVFADRAALTVADDIAASLRESETDRAFDGKGPCYIEWGKGLVAKVDTDFLSGPKPLAPFRPPSKEFAAEKAAWADERRHRWFGT